MKAYDRWLASLRKRAQASGSLSQWALLLSQRDGRPPAYHQELLRKVLDGKTTASPDLILDLDLISAPATQPKAPPGDSLPGF
ncbi:MAG: hypothetical protein ACQKBY_01085 [Verrucomicrobiales bacterium]